MFIQNSWRITYSMTTISDKEWSLFVGILSWWRRDTNFRKIAHTHVLQWVNKRILFDVARCVIRFTIPCWWRSCLWFEGNYLFLCVFDDSFDIQGLFLIVMKMATSLDMTTELALEINNFVLQESQTPVEIGADDFQLRVGWFLHLNIGQLWV